MCSNLILPDGQTISNVGELREFVYGINPTASSLTDNSTGEVDDGFDNSLTDNSCLCAVYVNGILSAVQLHARTNGLDDEVIPTAAHPRTYVAVGGPCDGQHFTRQWGTEPPMSVTTGTTTLAPDADGAWNAVRYQLVDDRYELAATATGPTWDQAVVQLDASAVTG